MLHRLVNMKQFTEELTKKKLTVKVMSFAYTKGIPNDLLPAAGGGFAHSTAVGNNPSRKYERYKPFTGLDAPVIEFFWKTTAR